MTLKALSIIPLLGASALTAQEVTIHQDLAPITKHVDTDGQHFSVTDINGDAAYVGELINYFVEIARQAGETNVGILDGTKLLDTLGINDFKAKGSSAKWMGDKWLNRTFYASDAAPSGIFTFVGESKTWSSPTFAPVSTDLVFETNIDLTKLPLAKDKLGKSLTNESFDILQNTLSQIISPEGLTLSQLQEKFTARLSVAIDLDESKTWDSGQGIELPTIQLVARIDGITWLDKHYGEIFRAASEVTEKNGITYISAPEMIPTPMGDLRPTIAIDKAKDQIWISLTPDYLQEAMANGEKLASSPHYKTSIESLPTTGNILSYASPQACQSLKAIADQLQPMIRDNKDLIIASPILDKITKSLTISKSGYIHTVQITDKGLALASKSPTANKGQSALGSPPMLLAGISTLFIGAKYYRDNANKAACHINQNGLQKAVRSVQNIENLQEGNQLTWDMILGNDRPLTEKPICPSGGTYKLRLTIPPIGTLACPCDHPEHQIPKEKTQGW